MVKADLGQICKPGECRKPLVCDKISKMCKASAKPKASKMAKPKMSQVMKNARATALPGNASGQKKKKSGPVAHVSGHIMEKKFSTGHTSYKKKNGETVHCFPGYLVHSSSEDHHQCVKVEGNKLMAMHGICAPKSKMVGKKGERKESKKLYDRVVKVTQHKRNGRTITVHRCVFPTNEGLKKSGKTGEGQVCPPPARLMPVKLGGAVKAAFMKKNPGFTGTPMGTRCVKSIGGEKIRSCPEGRIGVTQMVTSKNLGLHKKFSCVAQRTFDRDQAGPQKYTAAEHLTHKAKVRPATEGEFVHRTKHAGNDRLTAPRRGSVVAKKPCKSGKIRTPERPRCHDPNVKPRAAAAKKPAAAKRPAAAKKPKTAKK